MTGMRRVVVVDENGHISVREAPIPAPGTGEVLLEVEASAVTPGTSRQLIRAHRSESKADSRKLGYQVAGVVVDTGQSVDEFDAGHRIACMGAGYAYHSDYVCVPRNLCVALPDDVTYAEGAFNHLAATALHAVRRADVQVGEFVAVMGLGLVGQLTGQLAGVAGGRVAGVDQLPGRTEYARQVGFDHVVTTDDNPVKSVRSFTDGRGIDCGIIAFGGDGTDAFDDLIRMTKAAPDGHHYGRIAIVGNARIDYEFPIELGNMDVRAASRPGPGYHDSDWERGCDYPTEFRGDIEWTTRRNQRECLRLISESALDVESLITHRFPLAEANQGYAELFENQDSTLGVVLVP